MTSAFALFASSQPWWLCRYRQFGQRSNLQGCEEAELAGEPAPGWAKLERGRGLQ
jgi:hypothetical protein